MIGRIFQPKQTEEEKPRGFDDFEVRLGDTMRGERATLGKSLLDVQRELKIKATYIAAIENADPSAFETPGFIAGYVRSYARYLGMDPEWAFETFCAESDFTTAHGMSAQASTVQSARAERLAISGGDSDPFANPRTPFIPSGEAIFSRLEPAAIGSVLVLVLLIAGLGYGGWSVLQEVQRVQFAPVEQAPGVSASIDPLAPNADAVAAARTDVQTAAIAAPGPDSLDRLYRPEALDVPVLVPRDGPIAALDPKAVGVEGTGGATAAAATDSAADSATAPTQVASIDAAVLQVVKDSAAPVTIFATRPAWVQVKAADGTVILEKILDAGEKYQLPVTEEPPTLRAGYAGAVYFQIGDKTYGPAGKGGAVVKNIALGPKQLIQDFKLADTKRNPALAKVVAELINH